MQNHLKRAGTGKGNIMMKPILAGVFVLLVGLFAAQAQDKATMQNCLLIRADYSEPGSILVNPATGNTDYVVVSRATDTSQLSDYPFKPKTQLASPDGRFIL